MDAKSLTPSSVIDLLGGTSAVADDLSLADSTVSCWRERGIPAHRWPALVAAARQKRVKEITFEALARTYTDRVKAAG